MWVITISGYIGLVHLGQNSNWHGKVNSMWKHTSKDCGNYILSTLEFKLIENGVWNCILKFIVLKVTPHVVMHMIDWQELKAWFYHKLQLEPSYAHIRECPDNVCVRSLDT